jgi:hypothetical protein
MMQIELRLESLLAAKVVMRLREWTASKAELEKFQEHKLISGELNKQVQKLLKQ